MKISLAVSTTLLASCSHQVVSQGEGGGRVLRTGNGNAKAKISTIDTKAQKQKASGSGKAGKSSMPSAEKAAKSTKVFKAKNAKSSKSSKAKSEKMSSLKGAPALEQCLVDLDMCQNPTGGDGRMVSGEGIAEVPVAMVDFVKRIVTIPMDDTTKKTPLALPPDMLASFNGHCTHWEDYKSAPSSNDSQCDASKKNPNYPYFDDDSSTWQPGIPYQPSLEVQELLAETSGASLSAVQRMRIGSGANKHANDGAWCGMPMAGFNNDNRSVQEELAATYWKQCVLPRAGYMNVMECTGECDDEGNCPVIASFGYAGMERDVCYPAHQHEAQEAYWQVGGRGWWRTWKEQEAFDYGTETNTGGTPYNTHLHRAQGPHEFDTTGDLDADGEADTIVRPMIMIYFWGLANDSGPNNYHWSDQVRSEELTYKGHVSAHTCGTTARIPAAHPDFSYDVLAQSIKC